MPLAPATNTPPPDAAPSTPPWLLGPDAPCPPEQPSAQACPVCFCDWAPLAPKHCFLGPSANTACIWDVWPTWSPMSVTCVAPRAGWPAWGAAAFQAACQAEQVDPPHPAPTYAQLDFRAVAARGRRAPPPGRLASMGNRPPLRCALVVSPRQPPASGLRASRLRRACLTCSSFLPKKAGLFRSPKRNSC